MIEVRSAEPVKITKFVPPKEAAKELGMSVATMQYWMKIGKLDIGHVLPPRKGGVNYSYRVYRDKLNKYLGIEKVAHDEKAP